MAKFFVGQRVKKTRGTCAIGLTARISAISDFGDYDAAAVLDEGAVNNSGEVAVPGDEVLIHLDQWDPILPEGAPPSAFATLTELLDSLPIATPA